MRPLGSQVITMCFKVSLTTIRLVVATPTAVPSLTVMIVAIWMQQWILINHHESYMELEVAIGAQFLDVRPQQQVPAQKATRTRLYRGRPLDPLTVMMIPTFTIPEDTIIGVLWYFRTVA